MNELIGLARGGGLVGIRESSLYVEQKDAALNTPFEVVSRNTARDVLLVAIEAFDDALVGYTDHSFTLGTKTDALFERWVRA